MFPRNLDIKEAKGNIPAWMIAEKLNCHENTVYRLIRSKLSEPKKQEILNAIKEIKKELKKELRQLQEV